MGTEPTQQLWKLWQVEELPLERATGQLIQHVARLDIDNEAHKNNRAVINQTLQELQTSLLILRADVDALMAHTNMPPPKRRKKR